ncbi:hypothetical protein UY3_07378 [Chelonia mydas]|uniref:Uncharacterized protein n=1 Tax=Chelonia mydas TaxID=8469 RepID=M7BIE3_CHEMY|nr:hypothetical protein UY3_07378 [Chelonia mydas]
MGDIDDLESGSRRDTELVNFDSVVCFWDKTLSTPFSLVEYQLAFIIGSGYTIVFSMIFESLSNQHLQATMDSVGTWLVSNRGLDFVTFMGQGQTLWPSQAEAPTLLHPLSPSSRYMTSDR